MGFGPLAAPWHTAIDDGTCWDCHLGGAVIPEQVIEGIRARVRVIIDNCWASTSLPIFADLHPKVYQNDAPKTSHRRVSAAALPELNGK